MSSADTREELALMSGDSATEAFGKISKIIYLDELISSAAFNDLNDRVLALNEEVAVLHDEIGVRIREAVVEIEAEMDGIREDVTENTSDIAALSADVAANEVKIEAVSGDVIANRTDIDTLSASMIDNELVIAAAFNDVNDRILELSARTAPAETDPIFVNSPAYGITDTDIARWNQGGSGQTNVQADWDEADPTSDAYIKNKPAIPLIEKVTTAQYNAMEQAGTLDANTLYVIVD